jgi:C4-dicarboxylate-specific signal transduction histidine kinase
MGKKAGGVMNLHNNIQQKERKKEIKWPYINSALKSIAGRHKDTVREKSEWIRQMQSKFVQAQKMEYVGKLAGGIAHNSNNIRLTSNLSQALDMVKIDPGQMVQVMMNRVINTKDSIIRLTEHELCNREVLYGG